jgi:hypothetical protein
VLSDKESTVTLTDTMVSNREGDKMIYALYSVPYKQFSNERFRSGSVFYGMYKLFIQWAIFGGSNSLI